MREGAEDGLAADDEQVFGARDPRRRAQEMLELLAGHAALRRLQ